MNNLMELAWNSWVETREETLIFIESLSVEDMVRKLPRPGLDSFGYHFQELGVIQDAFTTALKTGEMDYSKMGFEEDPYLYSDHDRLKKFLIEIDNEFKKTIGNVDNPVDTINWGLPRNPSAIEHVFWLMQHETLHHGQLMAFCYIMGVNIPEELNQHWNMPPGEGAIVDNWIESAGWHKTQ